MAYENIVFEKEGAVGILTVSRPKSLNALDPPTLVELAACLETVRADDGVRCLVVTGAGDRAFVAGADIAAMVAMSPLEGKKFASLGLGVARTLEEMPIPVIAAVNGFALGGGLELALACDLIVTANTAKFGQPEINLGVIPGFGGTQRLARRIGLPLARELIYTGDMIDAEAAQRYGLVNRVVPAEACLDEAKTLARTMAGKPPVAIRQAKAAINAGSDMDLQNGCRFETEAFALSFSTVDKAEGMAAFLEKREPKFTGK